MNISQLLFSAQGRISRSTFWLKFFLPYVAIIFVLAILDIMMKTFSEEIGLGLFSGAFILISLYSSIVVSIKRLHDRNKSGWWYLLALVPIVGSIWFLIECGILKGTTGDNQYGPDPLAK